MHPAPHSDLSAPVLAGTVTSADLYRELVEVRRDVTSVLTTVQVGNERDK